MVTRVNVKKQRLPRSNLSNLVSIEENVIGAQVVYEAVLPC